MSKKVKTEGIVENELDRMIMVAAEQKLLPQLIWDFSKRNNSQQTVKKYKKQVKKIYTEQTCHPLIYNKQEARSHRQKFREKVLKLISHQLPIDYLKPVKVNGYSIMTYNDHPLESVNYSTKMEFKMFQQFSESKFKKDYHDIFDDKLEYKHQKLFKSVNSRKKQQSAITHPTQSHQISKFNDSPITTDSLNQISNKKIRTASLPKLIIRKNLMDRSHIVTPSTVRKKHPKIMVKIDEQQAIINRMKLIGGYLKIAEKSELSLTKQSIFKYLKEFYLRPNRILQFLSISSVQNYQTFSKIPQKLKLMPNQHIYFMIFLLYDSNNDGYICNQDLLKIQQIGKRCPLVRQDHLLLKNSAHKVKYENNLNYKQLYKIPDLTQTKYFNWVKNHNHNPNPEEQIATEQKQELKQYFSHLNRKKVFIHYEGFKKIFGNEKPFFWYDLLWRISGISFEGLKY